MKLGVIGGTGLYDLVGLRDVNPVALDTPFGKPSEAYLHGRLGTMEVYFLPRHGHGHHIMPSEINHRANIYGFKDLGVERVIAISAVGSLREDLRPRDVCLPDQYFDRTKQSADHTFFGGDLVAHVAFAEPICPDLRHQLHAVAQEIVSGDARYQGQRVQNGGTYVNMEGPAFSTKAESLYYRRFAFDVIGMTGLAEAKLCREAEICYASACMVTDYDCWHESEETVSVEMVLTHLKANAGLAGEILRRVVTRLTDARPCPCSRALENCIITRPDIIPPAQRERLAPIVGKYLK
ncbi:MAG: S-methyl-5'-thioadenosine phosphorylase [Verrucomicrobia bacterium]|nr:S-methyl-5'-thioadenosine phosphorylase [Verrucomicrobiota bacterium]